MGQTCCALYNYQMIYRMKTSPNLLLLVWHTSHHHHNWVNPSGVSQLAGPLSPLTNQDKQVPKWNAKPDLEILENPPDKTTSLLFFRECRVLPALIFPQCTLWGRQGGDVKRNCSKCSFPRWQLERYWTHTRGDQHWENLSELPIIHFLALVLPGICCYLFRTGEVLK